MTIVAISQRVDCHPSRSERRDALDQRWHAFLAACAGIALPVPNNSAAAAALIHRFAPDAVLLSGGNDLSDVGGDAPERDAVERILIDYALERALPLIGVCRGMQMLLHHFGAQLTRVGRHTSTRHALVIDGEEQDVNSYHEWSTFRVPAEFRAIALADDGSVEAMSHEHRPIWGIMWHPEREQPFNASDIRRMSRWLLAADHA